MAKYELPPITGLDRRITPEGRALHSLVLYDDILTKSSNPDINLAISQAYKRTLYEEKKKLIYQLGMPENSKSRKRVISEAKTALSEAGFPFTKRPSAE